MDVHVVAQGPHDLDPAAAKLRVRLRAPPSEVANADEERAVLAEPQIEHRLATLAGVGVLSGVGARLAARLDHLPALIRADPLLCEPGSERVPDRP